MDHIGEQSVAVAALRSPQAMHANVSAAQLCGGSLIDSVRLQGFNWESCKGKKHYRTLKEQAPQIAAAGYTCIWLPPPSDAVSPQGYLPRDLYELNSEYGTEAELRDCIKELQRWNLKVIADIVINHRCAHKQVRLATCAQLGLVGYRTAQLGRFHCCALHAV